MGVNPPRAAFGGCTNAHYRLRNHSEMGYYYLKIIAARYLMTQRIDCMSILVPRKFSAERRPLYDIGGRTAVKQIYN